MLLESRIRNKSEQFFYTLPHSGMGGGRGRDFPPPVNSSEFLARYKKSVYLEGHLTVMKVVFKQHLFVKASDVGTLIFRKDETT